jgi:hypothetical protein
LLAPFLSHDSEGYGRFPLPGKSHAGRNPLGYPSFALHGLPSLRRAWLRNANTGSNLAILAAVAVLSREHVENFRPSVSFVTRQACARRAAQNQFVQVASTTRLYSRLIFASIASITITDVEIEEMWKSCCECEASAAQAKGKSRSLAPNRRWRFGLGMTGKRDGRGKNV